jgi:hypothetical protein
MCGLCYGHRGCFRPFSLQPSYAFLCGRSLCSKFLLMATFSLSVGNVLCGFRRRLGTLFECGAMYFFSWQPILTFRRGLSVPAPGDWRVVLPPVLVCLLVMEMWAGIRAVECKVRARSFPSDPPGERFRGKVREPSGPKRQRRPWPCAQRPAGHNRPTGRQTGQRWTRVGPASRSSAAGPSAHRRLRRPPAAAPLLRAMSCVARRGVGPAPRGTGPTTAVIRRRRRAGPDCPGGSGRRRRRRWHRR